MEDFVAGFEETVDCYPSAADWITLHLEASPASDCDGQASRLVAVLLERPGRGELGQSAHAGMALS